MFNEAANCNDDDDDDDDDDDEEDDEDGGDELNVNDDSKSFFKVKLTAD